MALLLASHRIFGHQHTYHQPLTYKITTATVLAAILSLTAAPPHVLAFEAELPTSASHRLVATVQLVDAGDVVLPVTPEPDYSLRTASTLTVSRPVETVAGDWDTPPVLLAQAPEPTSRYSPTLGNPLVLEGEASFYSWDGCLGCNPLRVMANGQVLDDGALTIAIGAHLSYLVGHRARVTNLATNMTVDVLITDTGGFYQERYGERVADLTIASKEAIGMYGGVGQVRVEVY